MKQFLVTVFFLFSRLHAMSDVNELLSEASAHNAYFLYDDAIKILNEAIKLDPLEKEAYKERAFSYFELNRLDLALEDYKRVLNPNPPFRWPSKNYSFMVHPSSLGKSPLYLDFAKGLLHGSMLGGVQGSIQFVSSVRGGLTFLWSFACSPYDVSRELIEALKDMGEFIASGRIDILLQEAVPELFECSRCWHTWTEYTKGEKLGFIIGKYSILVFYYVATANVGVHFYNNLRRANIMAILGRYASTKNVQILEASSSFAVKSKSILKKAKTGSIIPHNPNVLPHVFTKKHRWDKFIQITGNHEKDFEKLMMFLEEQKILQCPRTLDFERGCVITYKYTKDMGREKIVALFEINKENLPLLRNAWVEVKPPYAP